MVIPECLHNLLLLLSWLFVTFLKDCDSPTRGGGGGRRRTESCSGTLDRSARALGRDILCGGLEGGRVIANGQQEVPITQYSSSAIAGERWQDLCVHIVLRSAQFT